MVRPSMVGPKPARGGWPGAENGPTPGFIGGLILVTAALPAALSLAQSIFCRLARSLGWRPSSIITCLASALDCSALGGLPPPPDCTEAQ